MCLRATEKIISIHFVQKGKVYVYYNNIRNKQRPNRIDSISMQIVTNVENIYASSRRKSQHVALCLLALRRMFASKVCIGGDTEHPCHDCAAIRQAVPLVFICLCWHTTSLFTERKVIIITCFHAIDLDDHV